MAEVHGVREELDLAPSVITRESRPLRLRLRNSASRWVPFASVVVVIAGAVWPLFMAQYHGGVGAFLVPLSAPFICWWLSRYVHRVAVPPFRQGYPYAEGDDDAGIIFVGNGKDFQEECWFSKSDITTHMIVFGSTGSGKTIFLLGLFYQALLCGSGVMFVDGKADNSVWWMVYAIARRLGREDDVLLINYLTGGMKAKLDHVPEWRTEEVERRRTNTTNPIADVGPEQARSLLVSLMPDGGADDVWKVRASALLGVVMRVLCYLRDNEEISGLDMDVVRENISLEKVMELAYRGRPFEPAAPPPTPGMKTPLAPMAAIQAPPGEKQLPDHIRQSVMSYLIELPGFERSKIKVDEKTEEVRNPLTGVLENKKVRKFSLVNAPKANEQQSYLTMQLTGVFEDLGETYGHIFNARQGEVDFKDVVFNRRILFVMLPSLEVDQDRLQTLGKFVVSAVRSALGPALGDTVEGDRKSVIERKPTTAKTPFFLILDEYGYYAVQGFAVVAAQARSLGVSVIFAGQDYPSFKRSSPEEAAATIANTNIKIGMKIEDSDETFKVLQDRGGQGKISQVQGMDARGSSGRVRAERDAHVQLMERINLRDLVSQGVGEGHIIFSDRIVRGNLVYIAPEKMSEGLRQAQVNDFLVVDVPNMADQKQFYERYRGLAKGSGQALTSSSELAAGDPSEGLGLVDAVNAGWLFHDFEQAKSEAGAGRAAAAAYAVGLMTQRLVCRAEASGFANGIFGSVDDGYEDHAEEDIDAGLDGGPSDNEDITRLAGAWSEQGERMGRPDLGTGDAANSAGSIKREEYQAAEQTRAAQAAERFSVQEEDVGSDPQRRQRMAEMREEENIQSATAGARDEQDAPREPVSPLATESSPEDGERVDALRDMIDRMDASDDSERTKERAMESVVDYVEGPAAIGRALSGGNAAERMQAMLAQGGAKGLDAWRQSMMGQGGVIEDEDG